MKQLGTSDLYRWIMRSTTDGLWILDDSGLTTFANDRLAEILGRTPEEMVGLPLADTLDAAGQEEFFHHLDDLADAVAGRSNLDCSLIRKDGSRIWALVSHSPLLDDDGVRRGWLHRVTELNDRKLLLDKAVSSEQQLAEAQSIAKVGSWEWDVANDVVTWSDELYRMYNLRPQEFEATYEGFLSHVHPEDRPIVEAAVGSAFTDTDTFKFDARIIKQGGEEGWVRGRGRVTRDASGAPVRMSGTSHEITDSVLAAQEVTAARDAAMQASRMKSDFLATMSHEIRTPLNGVIGLTDLLLRTDLEPTQERLATGIDQAGRTLLGLVNDILDLSKIEAGKLELEVIDFNVRDVVEQVVALMAESARLKRVDLVVACHADVPRALQGDPVRFGQVLTNLVSNAVKFTTDGQVTVRVNQESRRAGTRTLRVEVSDTGVGIPLAAQPTLFDPFTQADASTTREYGGSGLGLTICRRLVEALGGMIGFSSTPGAGSTFWFTGTFQESRAEAAMEHSRMTTSTVDAGGSAALGKVLVAEDNVVNQMVARGMLEGLGYSVEFAQNGLEAVQALTAAPGGFVAVLMDCQMPRLDGFAATRAIREREQPGDRVPIIAMTASTLVGEQERCLAAGMDDFMVKPVGFELLESTLARWVEGSEPAADGPHLADDPAGVLDLARVQMLQELRPGDRSLFDQFVDAFLARIPEDVGAIEEAVRAVDHPALVRAAHVLKGSAQNLGAAALGRVCQTLEEAGERGDGTEANALLPALTEQVERTSYALRGLVADDPGSVLSLS